MKMNGMKRSDLFHITESIFTSALETNGADSSLVSQPCMTRVEFVFGLVKVALRSADEAVRNVKSN